MSEGGDGDMESMRSAVGALGSENRRVEGVGVALLGSSLSYQLSYNSSQTTVLGSEQDSWRTLAQTFAVLTERASFGGDTT